jgi:hypothetical protein
MFSRNTTRDEDVRFPVWLLSNMTDVEYYSRERRCSSMQSKLKPIPYTQMVSLVHQSEIAILIQDIASLEEESAQVGLFGTFARHREILLARMAQPNESHHALYLFMTCHVLLSFMLLQCLVHRYCRRSCIVFFLQRSQVDIIKWSTICVFLLRSVTLSSLIRLVVSGR